MNWEKERSFYEEMTMTKLETMRDGLTKLPKGTWVFGHTRERMLENNALGRSILEITGAPNLAEAFDMMRDWKRRQVGANN